MSFFEKRKKRKLYQQWVDKSGLPEENIPVEFTPEGAGDEEHWDQDRGSESPPRGRSTFVIHLTMRHLLILLLIIAALLILSSTLIAILIMRSC